MLISSSIRLAQVTCSAFGTYPKDLGTYHKHYHLQGQGEAWGGFLRHGSGSEGFKSVNVKGSTAECQDEVEKAFYKLKHRLVRTHTPPT